MLFSTKVHTLLNFLGAHLNAIFRSLRILLGIRFTLLFTWLTLLFAFWHTVTRFFTVLWSILHSRRHWITSDLSMASSPIRHSSEHSNFSAVHSRLHCTDSEVALLSIALKAKATNIATTIMKCKLCIAVHNQNNHFAYFKLHLCGCDHGLYIIMLEIFTHYLKISNLSFIGNSSF